MNNYIAPGNSVTVVMPYAVSAGAGVQVGSALFGVAQNTYSSGATGVIVREGVFTTLAKATGAAWAAGDRLFWDNTNKNLTKTSTGNLQVGICIAAAATGDTTSGEVLVESVTPAGT
jgi:predicted RecA/RadA family phage recombinase